MKVKDVMHLGAACAAPGALLTEIAKRMREEDVGALPVVEGGRVIGIVTDRDIAIRGLAYGGDVSAITAREVMSRDVACCSEDDVASEAIKAMERRQVRRMPVLDANHQLVGMLSLGDIAHCRRPDLTDEVLKAVSAHHP